MTQQTNLRRLITAFSLVPFLVLLALVINVSAVSAFTDTKTGTVSSLGEDELAGTGTEKATQEQVTDFLNEKKKTTQGIIDLFNMLGLNDGCGWIIPMSCADSVGCYNGANLPISSIFNVLNSSLDKTPEEMKDDIFYQTALTAVSNLYFKEGSKWCVHYNACQNWTTKCFEFNKQDDQDLFCKNTNTYNYTFRYETNLGGSWVDINDTNAHKCERVRVVFSPLGDFGASLEKTANNSGQWQLSNYYNNYVWHVPPTDLLDCSDQTNCLSKANEYQLTTETWGKGVQKIPSGFVDNIQEALNSADTKITCSGGECISYASGTHVINTTAPATSYYAQCRGYEKTINNPETTIPAITSNASVNYINRPPAATISFAKNPIAPDEAVQVTCDIVDPDSCIDKIVKVKWSCFNNQGQQTNCFFLDKNGIWRQNTITEEIPEATATNPYRAVTTFKGTQIGSYAIACEASDNDANTASTSNSIAGLSVGEIPAHMSFCAILSDDGNNKTVCDSSAKVTYKAYQSGIEADQYEWKCSGNDTAKSGGITQECSYSNAGIYNPILRIHDKNSNEWINCPSQTKTTISQNSSCTVGLKLAGSTADYMPNIQVSVGDEVEAKISRECLAKGDINWIIGDGSKISENKNNETIKLKFSSGGTQSIKANTQNVTCGQAEATVKDKIQWGN